MITLLNCDIFHFFLLTAFNFHSFFDIDHQSFDHKKRAVKKNSNYPVYIV